MNSVNSREDRVASMIAMPFLTVATSAQMVKAATSRNDGKDKIAEPVTSQAAEPVGIQERPAYRIADRVQSHLYGDLKVSFYQYFREGRIVAIARKNGHLKEKVLTPEIAYGCDVAFDMNGAIAWIRKTGFKDVGFARIKEVAPWEDYPEETKVQSTEAPKETALGESASRAKGQTNRVPAQQRTDEASVLERTSAGRPFTGTIVQIGESERPGRDGNPPFNTYAVTLRSETSNYEKEFLGEHLSKLREEHDLKVGDLITLQRQVEKFSVTVGGKTDIRTRNTYAIEVIR